MNQFTQKLKACAFIILDMIMMAKERRRKIIKKNLVRSLSFFIIILIFGQEVVTCANTYSL